MYSYMAPFVRITNDMAKLGISYQISEVHWFLSPVHAYAQLRHPTNHAIPWHGMPCHAPESLLLSCFSLMHVVLAGVTCDSHTRVRTCSVGLYAGDLQSGSSFSEFCHP